MKFNRFLKFLALLFVGVLFVFWLWAKDKYVVPIAMYHHVSEGRVPHNLNVVDTNVFESHMAFIQKHGYQVISLDELVTGIQQGRKFLHKTVVLTFDDAYADFVSTAFPVLQRHRFGSTMFVPTGYMGGFADWDRDFGRRRR